MIPALFGVPDPTLGAVLAIAWLFILVEAVYQYIRGTQSREQFSIVLSMGACWLAYSLLQVSDAVTGGPRSHSSSSLAGSSSVASAVARCGGAGHELRDLCFSF